jgi:DNA polymerase-1
MRCGNCPMPGSPCAVTTGPPDAKIALVGRNPGRTEAETGIPFTGPSGVLLDATLEVVGLNRSDILITNAVSCHLHGDVPPSKDMYIACHARLMDEISHAKVVVSFGTDATAALLGSSGGITSIVGSIYEIDGKVVLPTFHPAYILRGAISAYDDLEETLRRAKGLVDGTIPMPKPLPYEDVYYCEDAEDILYVLHMLAGSETKTLAIDTETDSARDPNWNILLLQLSDGESAWVFDGPTLRDDERCREAFQDMLEDPTRRWIFHNAAFDLQQLWHHWDIMPEHFEDTMALALCLDEHLNRAGLKRLVNRYLSVPPYEDSIQKFLKSKKTPYSAIPREILASYGGFDAIFTFQIFPILKRMVEAEGNGKLYPFLCESQRTFALMAYDGVLVDQSYVDVLRQQYYPIRDQITSDMQAYAREKGFKARESVKSCKSDDLNPDSPTQLLWFVTRYLRIATDTTDKTFIERYASHPFVEMLSRFRAISKMLSTYVDGIADDIWPDGRIHPDFLHGTETGRLTIKNPPLQTLPRNTSSADKGLQSIKRLFVVPPGYVLVHVDYKTLEVRIAWLLSQDEQLGEALMSADFHRVVAAAIFHKAPEDITKEERIRSKFVTFGLMYNRQAYSLTSDLHCSEAEAQSYLDQFFARFPKYAKWREETQKEAIQTGILKTDFGRRRRWKLITPDIEKHIINEALNFPIQSTASDICLLSMIRLDKQLRDRKWGRTLFSVHDSIEFEIRADVVDDACRLIKEVMEHPFKTDVVFEVDVEIGPSLGQTEEWQPRMVEQGRSGA